MRPRRAEAASAAEAPVWRVRLSVPAALAPVFAEALESFCSAAAWPAAETGEAAAIEATATAEPDRPALRAALGRLAEALAVERPRLRIERMKPRDWLAEGLRTQRPVDAGRYRVHGSHAPPRAAPGRITIKIDAATAFGTGRHASTRGCLMALDGLAAKGAGVRRALDMGTGSGVLAIAIAKTWDARVLACDNDGEAVRVARVNARANGVRGRVAVTRADGFAGGVVAAAPFDLIAANLLADPLVAMAPALARALAPGGAAILSGFLAGDGARVAAAYRACGLSPLGRIDADGWQTRVLRRPGAA